MIITKKKQKDRSLSINQALTQLVDLKQWYLTGQITTELSRRFPKDVLKTTNRLFWLEQCLHDLACSLPLADKDLFEEYRHTLLHELCL